MEVSNRLKLLAGLWTFRVLSHEYTFHSLKCVLVSSLLILKNKVKTYVTRKLYKKQLKMITQIEHGHRKMC